MKYIVRLVDPRGLYLDLPPGQAVGSPVSAPRVSDKRDTGLVTMIPDGRQFRARANTLSGNAAVGSAQEVILSLPDVFDSVALRRGDQYNADEKLSFIQMPPGGEGDDIIFTVLNVHEKSGLHFASTLFTAVIERTEP